MKQILSTNGGQLSGEQLEQAIHLLENAYEPDSDNKKGGSILIKRLEQNAETYETSQFLIVATVNDGVVTAAAAYEMRSEPTTGLFAQYYYQPTSLIGEAGPAVDPELDKAVFQDINRIGEGAESSVKPIVLAEVPVEDRTAYEQAGWRLIREETSLEKGGTVPEWGTDWKWAATQLPTGATSISGDLLAAAVEQQRRFVTGAAPNEELTPAIRVEFGADRYDIVRGQNVALERTRQQGQAAAAPDGPEGPARGQRGR